MLCAGCKKKEAIFKITRRHIFADNLFTIFFKKKQKFGVLIYRKLCVWYCCENCVSDICLEQTDSKHDLHLQKLR